MAALVPLCRSRQVLVLEDACQAAGAMVEGRPAATWGDVGVHSFGGSKLLSAGRGGAIVTNRADVAQRIRLFKERGNDLSPLSQMQAAVLRPQLEALAERHWRRAEHARRIGDAMAERAGFAPFLGYDEHGADQSAAYYKFGFRYDAGALGGLSRKAFCAAMRAEGFAVDPGFRGLHRTHSRRRFRTAGPLTVADAIDEDVVTLHHPLLLESHEEVDEFVRALDKIRAAETMIRDQWTGG